jgi:regulatory protein
MVRVHLSDGSFFLLHAEVFAREGIRTGDVLAPIRRAELLAQSERIFARIRALSLLARGAHSRKGLTQKLQARGFSPEAVSEAVRRMGELGYLDDQAFADGWVRSRMATRTDGWLALYRGLRGKGVARELAEQALEANCPYEVELERARVVAAGMPAAAAIRRLKGRGFRSRTIARILKEGRETAHEAPAD